jgi:aerobic carbon-monoxide dehydrogenase large subunit
MSATAAAFSIETPPPAVGRKEDERFLRGRGQYVGDFRMPWAREVAFVRSSVAHAYLRSITIPEKHKGMVVTADDLTNVKPMRTTTSVSGLKHSREPILAAGKVRFVGEIIAACVGRSRAEAEDIAASVQLEFEELTAVVDMLEARKVAGPLVHDDWNDNIFVTFFLASLWSRRCVRHHAIRGEFPTKSGNPQPLR